MVSGGLLCVPCCAFVHDGYSNVGNKNFEKSPVFSENIGRIGGRGYRLWKRLGGS